MDTSKTTKRRPRMVTALIETFGFSPAIATAVNQLKVPASFAFAFYELRGHVGFVRRRLQGAPASGV